MTNPSDLAHRVSTLTAVFLAMLTLVLGLAGSAGVIQIGEDSLIMILLGAATLTALILYLRDFDWGAWIGAICLLANAYYLAWPSENFLNGLPFLMNSHRYLSVLYGLVSLAFIGTSSGQLPSMAPASASSMKTRPQSALREVTEEMDESMFKYSLELPDGRRLGVMDDYRVFGRKDFENLVPRRKLKYISLRHFLIRRVRGSYMLKDLHSTHGIVVDGHELLPGEEVPLRYGSTIDVAGVLELIFYPKREERRITSSSRGGRPSPR